MLPSKAYYYEYSFEFSLHDTVYLIKLFGAAGRPSILKVFFDCFFCSYPIPTNFISSEFSLFCKAVKIVLG